MLSLLVVDDEPLSRMRLRTLVGECTEPEARVDAEAATAQEALRILDARRFEAVLLDIHMPETDGMALARALRGFASPPKIIFVTAYSEHAVEAFELQAIDYLTKPVRRARLQQALMKVRQALDAERRLRRPQTDEEEFLLISGEHGTRRLPIDEIIYIKADLKYLVIHATSGHYIHSESLTRIEERFPGHFLRVHRSALIDPRRIRAVEQGEGDFRVVRLDGADEAIAVSRRYWSTLKQKLFDASPKIS